jgi:hypothetical protein
MPKFITIGYGDRAGYDRTSKSVRDAAHAHDEKLQRSGAIMGIAGLPVQVRNHGNDHVQTQNRPYMDSQLPVAGFSVIEAPNMDAAIEMMSQTPCAVAYGVVEVWPLEQSQQETDEKAT